MKFLGSLFRATTVTLLLVFALLAVAMSVLALASIPAGVAFTKTNAARYKATGDYAENFNAAYHEYPSRDQLRAWASQRGYGRWAEQVSGARPGGSSVACGQEDDFEVLPSDTYIISRWRGEWFDCYALPSGRTNVVLGIGIGEVLTHIGLWAAAFGAALAAWKVRPKTWWRKRAVALA